MSSNPSLTAKHAVTGEHILLSSIPIRSINQSQLLQRTKNSPNMDTLRRRLLRRITVQHRDAADANRRTDTAGAPCFCRVCCVATLRKEERSTQTDTTAGAARGPRRRLCCIVPHHEEHANTSQNDVAAPMGRPRRWFRGVRRAMSQVVQPPCGRSSIAVMDSGPESEAKAYKPSQEITEEPTTTDGSNEEVAAVTIQAYFRAHLARRAYRAMKSLVRLQAVARGMYVRRQAEVAIHCMQALVRLQIRVRARQLLHKVERDT